MSAYDRESTFRCVDCLVTVSTDDGCAPPSWLSAKPPDAPVTFRCGACAALHRGATARVEGAWPVPVTSERLGVALVRLLAAKRERGVDWTAHTSWCSDQLLFVVLVRRAGAALGRPFTGPAVDVLERAAEYAEEMP